MPASLNGPSLPATTTPPMITPCMCVCVCVFVCVCVCVQNINDVCVDGCRGVTVMCVWMGVGGEAHILCEVSDVSHSVRSAMSVSMHQGACMCVCSCVFVCGVCSCVCVCARAVCVCDRERERELERERERARARERERERMAPRSKKKKPRRPAETQTIRHSTSVAAGAPQLFLFF
jgi:hypothetical protein